MQITFNIRQGWRAAALAAGLMLSSCQTMVSSGPGPELVACQSFEPVTWSANDTPKTIRNIKEHNAAWSAICGD